MQFIEKWMTKVRRNEHWWCGRLICEYGTDVCIWIDHYCLEYWNGRARDHLIRSLAPSACILYKEYNRWPQITNAWVELFAVGSMNDSSPGPPLHFGYLSIWFRFDFSSSELMWILTRVSVAPSSLFFFVGIVLVRNYPCLMRSFLSLCCIAVADVVVMAAGADHHVPAGVALHHWRTRLQYDDLLRSRWTSWTYHYDRQNHLRRCIFIISNTFFQFAFF